LKKNYHNIGFWEKRQFFAEHCWKSQKIVILTSTPDNMRPDLYISFHLLRPLECG
jgi:hypothetical protein